MDEQSFMMVTLLVHWCQNCFSRSANNCCREERDWQLVHLLLTELYSGLLKKNDVHSLETVLLTTLVHYTCEKRRGVQPVNLMETVNLTQKYCSVRTELARAGETYCREQLAFTKLDYQLSANWMQVYNSLDVSVLPHQLTPSPTCALWLWSLILCLCQSSTGQKSACHGCSAFAVVVVA